MINSAFSLRARLTLIFVLFFGGTLCGYSYYVYKTVNSVFQDQFDSLLLDFAADITDSIDFSLMGGIRVDSRQFQQDRRVFPFSFKETVIQIRDIKGQTLQKSMALKNLNLPFSQQELFLLYKNKFMSRNWTSKEDIVGNRSFRLLNYRIMSPTKPPMILQVAVPDRFVRENSIQILNIFTISVPIVLLISAILGYSYSTFGLTPLRRLIERLKSIGPRDLRQRLSLPRAKDEIFDVSVSINSLLERIEKAFRSQETFVSDASHQLKTPLAILKAELEMMSKEVHSPESLEKVESLREEVDSLISMVGNLLLLARVDAGEDQLVLTEVALDEVVTTAVERLTHLAKGKNIRLKLNLGETLDMYASMSFSVRGDADLLVSLFQSLLENSIKYSPADSEICITIKNQGVYLSVDIVDQGPGIPESALNKVLERFHRIPHPSSPPGSGLGLPIAKRIADLHEAQLELKNRPGGGLVAHLDIKTF